MLGLVIFRFGYFRLGYLKFSQVWLFQVKLFQIQLDLVILGQVILDQVILGQPKKFGEGLSQDEILLAQDRLGQIRPWDGSEIEKWPNIDI